MAEFIFEISDALYNEETGGAVMKPEYKGKLTRCKDCKYYDNSNEDEPYCNRLVMHMDGNDNWFCGDAVRKEE